MKKSGPVACVPYKRQGGQTVYYIPLIEQSLQLTYDQLAMFHTGIKRFVNPHEYPVGLELSLFELRTKLILKARGLVNNHEAE